MERSLSGSAAGYPLPVVSKRNAALEAMIEEATVDAYNDDEQLTGLYTMIEDNLAVPFTTTVLGVEVTVRKVDLADDSFDRHQRHDAPRRDTTPGR